MAYRIGPLRCRMEGTYWWVEDCSTCGSDELAWVVLRLMELEKTFDKKGDRVLPLEC